MSERMDTSVDRLAAALEALEPFARLARPIAPGHERTFLESILGTDGTEELQLSTFAGNGVRIEKLDAEDFRRAERVRLALSTPAGPTPLPSCPVCGKGPSDKDDARGWCTGCSENVPDTTEAPLSALQRLGQEFEAGEPVAWMYVSPHDPDNVRMCRFRQRFWVDDYCWSETPLHAHPVAPAALTVDQGGVAQRLIQLIEGRLELYRRRAADVAPSGPRIFNIRDRYEFAAKAMGIVLAEIPAVIDVPPLSARPEEPSRDVAPIPDKELRQLVERACQIIPHYYVQWHKKAQKALANAAEPAGSAPDLAMPDHIRRLFEEADELARTTDQFADESASFTYKEAYKKLYEWRARQAAAACARARAYHHFGIAWENMEQASRDELLSQAKAWLHLPVASTRERTEHE